MSCPRFVVCIDALFVGMTRRTSSCGSWIKSMVGWTNGDSLSDVDLLHSIRVCWFVLRFQLRVAKVTGGAASKLAKIKFVRKSIARVLTVYNQTQKERLREHNWGKYTPTDLRAKKTRAIRRRLTKVQASTSSFCTRVHRLSMSVCRLAWVWANCAMPMRCDAMPIAMPICECVCVRSLTYGMFVRLCGGLFSQSKRTTLRKQKQQRYFPQRKYAIKA